MESTSCLNSDIADSGPLIETIQRGDDTKEKQSRRNNKFQDIIHTRVETFFHRYGRLVAK